MNTVALTYRDYAAPSYWIVDGEAETIEGLGLVPASLFPPR